MATDYTTAPRGGWRYDIDALRGNWGWFLVLGLLLIVVGVLAIILSVPATAAAMLALGVLALIGAGVQVVSAFWARRWEGVVLHLLVGVVYLVLGLLLLARPFAAAEALTLLMAGLFLVSGLFRVVYALATRFRDWGWALLSGVVGILLGVMIWLDWPASGLWVIGLFVGIDMLLTGWTWVILSLGLRRLPDAASPVG